MFPWAIGLLVAPFGIALFPSAFAPSALASHLSQASEAKLEEFLKLRLEGLPTRHRQIAIAPSLAPRKLPRATGEVPGEVRRQLANGSALSLLYWDGKALKYDLAREDIRNDLPVYGMSMSKSITSYLLGRALCEGLIHSLDDPIENYVPALSGTFYGAATIRNALDMASGDRALYSNTSRGAQSDWKEYVIPVTNKGGPVVDAMRALGNRVPSKKVFAYRNANTDAVAMVVSAVAPEGLGKFASRTLARDAGFEHPAMYLADRNDTALAFAWFYATRLDWLRAAILIGEEFKAAGCVGDYLRSAVSESVSIGSDAALYRRYGKFFWSDRNRASRKHVTMLGHGGQHIYIDLEGGRVLYLLSIRIDYRIGKIYEAVFD